MRDTERDKKVEGQAEGEKKAAGGEETAPRRDPRERTSTGREWMRIFPVTGVFLLIGAFAWAIHKRFFDPASIALGVLGFLLFLTAFIRAEAANLKHYILAGLSAFFVLGICISAYVLVSRHNPRIDLTEQGIHTLSSATQSYLQLLKKDVEIVAFDVNREPYRILDRYAEATPRVEWALYDPRAVPEIARGYDTEVADGMIFITHGDKTKRISVGELDEKAVTSAIIEVTREKRIKVYFLSGHGELSFEPPPPPKPNEPEEPEAQNSLFAFREFLSTRAIEVEELNLLARGFIPDDATLVVIAGPRRDLEEVEARELRRYLEEGGNLLVHFDLPKFNVSISFTQLTQLLREYGVTDNELVLVDLRGERTRNSPFLIPLLNYNAEHPITEPMTRSGDVIYLPLVRVLGRTSEPPAGVELAPLVMSSEEAWVEPFARLFVAQRQPQLTPPPREQWGPRPIGWAVEKVREDGAPTRVVVYGSSELVRDGYINVQNSAAYLMLNTVNWLTAQEDTVAVPRRVIAGTPLTLTNAELQLILIIVAMAFPMAILAGGVTYAALIRRT